MLLPLNKSVIMEDSVFDSIIQSYDSLFNLIHVMAGCEQGIQNYVENYFYVW